MMSATQLFLIGLGGGLGSVLRVLVAEWIPASRLPWGTVSANILGSLLIGWVFAKFEPTAAGSGHWPAFLALGFCGGFTTFSSFSWQTLEQLRQGQTASALVHVLISVGVCLLATWLGWKLGRVQFG